MSLKIVFCWRLPTGYMRACWRELALRQGIELFIIALNHREGCNSEFDNSSLMAGIPHRLLRGNEIKDRDLVGRLVVSQKPDVVCISGWHYRSYRSLVYRGDLARSKFVMCMDTPRERGLKQALSRGVFGSYLNRINCAFVTGERCAQLGRYLGFKESRVKRGCTYGVDHETLCQLFPRRKELVGGWPRRFLFLGRYERMKGLDLLITAYSKYRQQVADAWPLTCCGSGPLGEMLRLCEGVEDRGFLQPEALTEPLRESGALVLPSLFEPWASVIVESCSAGLPVVCSEACGAGVELIREHYNGLVIPTGNSQAIVRALLWLHHHRELLPEMGRRSVAMAAPYAAQCWADRVVNALEELLAA